MKKVGIYICNYNGKDYVLGCIESLQKQSFTDYDISLVDNASTDGTVDAVKKMYPQVNIIENPENLGGAGGFDKGLRTGLDVGYDYIVLLDNDVRLDEKLLQNMHDFMEGNKDTGIVGAKVMIMDLPDTIQDYGGFLDFDKYIERCDYVMQKDSDKLPEVNDCDYVPTCCVMARREALLEAGTMPADNFIYYDDIEMSHRMRLKGWKVCSLGNARVWHKGGFRKAVVNTFSKYYFLRNRFNFFAKYVDKTRLDDFIEKILDETFMRLYGFNAKNLSELFETSFYAFDDFVHGIRGKADDYKIKTFGESETPLEGIVKKTEKVHIILDDILDFENADKLFVVRTYICEMTRINPNVCLYFSCDNSELDIEKLYSAVCNLDKENKIKAIQKAKEDESYDVVFKQCNHVSEVKSDILPMIYIDRFCNCITSEEEYIYFRGMEAARTFFKNTYRSLLKENINKLRNES